MSSNFCEKNPKIIRTDVKDEKGVNIKGGIPTFVYEKTGKDVPKVLKARIMKMGVPPMYSELWVAKSARNPIQVVWNDKKGRKQYLYNKSWNSAKKDEKYDRMKSFVKKLPNFWKQVEKDNLSKDMKIRMMSYMFLVVKETFIRVGNEKYYKQNGSVGLTTLRKEHMEISGKDKLKLKFKGKSHKEHELEIKNPKLVKYLKGIVSKIKSGWIFTVSGTRITPIDLNRYLQQTINSKKFTVKDFRTIAANWIFIKVIKDLNETTFKKNMISAIKITAENLGHNPGTTKKSYISENLVDLYIKDPVKFKKTSELKLLKFA
jgi:DNA topoisomerase-1